MENKKGSVLIWSVILVVVLILTGGIIFLMQIDVEESELGCISDSDCEAGFRCGVEEIFAASVEDCVGNSFCHSNYCINKEFKGDPGFFFCSQGCSSVLDCGNGECILEKGRCGAIEFSSGNKTFHPQAFECIKIEVIGE